MVDFGSTVQHIWISAIGFLAGVTLGKLVGYPLGWLVKRIRASIKVDKIILYLIPWRSVLAGLAVLNIFPFYAFWVLHGGLKFGIFNVGYIVFLCVLALTIHKALQNNNETVDLKVLYSCLRSLAVFSPVLLTYYGFWAGGGMGLWLYQSIPFPREIDPVNFEMLILGVILFHDLVAGVIQYFLDLRIRNIPLLAVD